MFLPRCTLSLAMLILVAVATGGCMPPVGKKASPSGGGLSEDASPGSGVTVPVSLATERVEETPAAEELTEESRLDEHYEIVLAKNPLYNEKDPVLYDSGFEDNNDSCMICHIDFEKELISATHLEAGVTCMACHGDSEVHRADEFNIMRPDVVWGRAEMVRFCEQCHPKHKHPEKVDAFLEEWDSKRRPNGRWIQAGAVCTECHGKHAIVTEAGDFK